MPRKSSDEIDDDTPAASVKIVPDDIPLTEPEVPLIVEQEPVDESSPRQGAVAEAWRERTLPVPSSSPTARNVQAARNPPGIPPIAPPQFAMQSGPQAGIPVNLPQEHIPLLATTPTPGVVSAPGIRFPGFWIGSVVFAVCLVFALFHFRSRFSLQQWSQQGVFLVSAVAEKSREGAQGLLDQAKLKKLELHDLPRAEYAIGLKALQDRSLSEALTEDLRALKKLDQQIREKKTTPSATESATLADRAKQVAAEARRKLELEQRLHQRKKLITKMGRRLRSSTIPCETPSFAEEIVTANKILTEIAQLRSGKTPNT